MRQKSTSLILMILNRHPLFSQTNFVVNSIFFLKSTLISNIYNWSILMMYYKRVLWLFLTSQFFDVSNTNILPPVHLSPSHVDTVPTSVDPIYILPPPQCTMPLCKYPVSEESNFNHHIWRQQHYLLHQSIMRCTVTNVLEGRWTMMKKWIPILKCCLWLNCHFLKKM